MTPTKSRMSQKQRIEAIRRQLLQFDEVSVKDMAKQFNVSDMTVRRDLDLMQSRGEIIHTHGGAALAKRLTFEFAFRDRQNRNQELKEAIAKQAIEHVSDGDTVMLDTGTTTLAIAKALAGTRSVTIITTSLAIISQVQFADNIEVILLGGFLRGGSPDVHGPLTEQNIDYFKTDVAFMGADAVDSDGVTYAQDLRIVNLDRKMALNTEKVIVAADSAKFGKTAMCRVLEPGEYTRILTTADLDEGILAGLHEKNIKVELC